MTKKRTANVFTLSDAIASSIQETIPPAQMAKLDGAQSQKILQAVAQCAGQVIAAITPRDPSIPVTRGADSE